MCVATGTLSRLLAGSRARECARAMMTPVVAACAERMRTAPGSVPAGEFEALREKAVRLVFEAFAENAAHVTRADVAALIGATLVDGDATTFVNRCVFVHARSLGSDSGAS